jgi:hypothetical protein
MRLLNCASALTAVALLAVPPIIAVDAAETAKAILKDTKGLRLVHPDPRRSAASAFATAL